LCDSTQYKKFEKLYLQSITNHLGKSCDSKVLSFSLNLHRSRGTHVCQTILSANPLITYMGIPVNSFITKLEKRIFNFLNEVKNDLYVGKEELRK
jgi:hypothetical protein